MVSDQSNATAALLWVQMGSHPTLVLFFFYFFHPTKCPTPFVHFTQITRKSHLVQLASAKNARRRQNIENAPEAHAHEYMVSRAPPNSKRTQLFASAEGASEKILGKSSIFTAKNALNQARNGCVDLLPPPPQTSDFWRSFPPPQTLLAGGGGGDFGFPPPPPQKPPVLGTKENLDVHRRIHMCTSIHMYMY